jgi:hypothetical protein
MRVTDEMVEQACEIFYHDRDAAASYDDNDRHWMHNALVAVVHTAERQQSRWERFSEPEISVLTAAMTTLDTDGAPAGAVEYAQRLVNEIRAVLHNESIPKVSRWDAFSDEEVGELYAGSMMYKDGSSKLARDLAVVVRQRKGGYQGPGVYKTLDREMEVLGRHGESGGVALRDVGDSSGFLYFETWSSFNSRHYDGTPAYRYLRPLGESS